MLYKGWVPPPLPNLRHILCSKVHINWLGHTLPPSKYAGYITLHKKKGGGKGQPRNGKNFKTF